MAKNIRRTGLLLVIFSIIMITVSGLADTKALAATQLSNQVEKIINKKVKQTDPAKKKLKKLFNFVEKNYNYKRTMEFTTYSGWEQDYALEMYSEKVGSCYHFAAAYAFLAKKATGYNVHIGVGETNGFSKILQKHAWIEININSKWYICDPNMDKYAANSSGKYFLKRKNKLKSTYNNFKNVQYFAI